MDGNKKLLTTHMSTGLMGDFQTALTAWELAKLALLNLPMDAPLLVRVDAVRCLELAQIQVTEQAKHLIEGKL